MNNPVALIKSVFMAGLFALLGMYAFSKVSGSANPFARVLP